MRPVSTGPWKQLNRRSPSADHAEERVFPREFAGGADERPRTVLRLRRPPRLSSAPRCRASRGFFSLCVEHKHGLILCIWDSPVSVRQSDAESVPDPGATMSTDDELKAELERLKAENEKLKNRQTRGVGLKVSEKGGVSVYGLGRFPVTLYKEQWTKLLDMAEDIRTFIRENDSKLKTKE
jgi:hypothetical protein